MTALADRPHILLTEHFEEAARILARLEEGARLEFIDGKIRSKPMPDGDHGRIVEWLMRHCIQSRPELWLYPDQGLKVQAYRSGRARPDGSLAASGAFVGQGEWADPDPVLMVFEVTSYDSDTDRRDRVEKPRAYAETGIPLFLLIDREAGQVTLHSEPDGVRYEDVRTVPFGRTLRLPDPVGITLETEALKDWVG
ncbi:MULTISPECIES: Uma2 family endonuclease [Streptomyces]|uniref:Uma2 family endonuclease n=1 Tax=Streptomyces celluloflavus TaxID=58344 RepID=A0ABW7R6N3_9ACTN|nr:MULTISPECIES: Uma2 family endonuclease [Streptomyces]MYU52387.1 Uma2 family endonuclease [Streptomyces sp. SID7805]WSK14979.1 Uma2 family endonuclease [Streptomyces celluloflavus]